MAHDLTHVVVLVAALSVLAQWLAWRLRIPAIILLIAAGVVAGPGLGLIDPSADFGPLMQPLIGLFVAVILFEGGLNLRLFELRDAGPGVKRLAILGVPLSWALGSAAAHHLGGLSWPVALLLGAIIVVTGPTVILPLLRQARLKRRPASLLKWEGIVNDPLGALLAVLVYEYFIHAERGQVLGQVLAGVVWAAMAGVVSGGAAAFVVGMAYRRGQVPEFLKPPILLAMVLVVYVLANRFQDEAGLLAVTVFGLALGNMNLPSIVQLRRFKESLTVLLVSATFILLTADLHPRILAQLDWRGAALLAALIFLVRPASVLLCTIGAGMAWQERVLLAWVAPRGIVAAAVAGFFAPHMVAQGHADAALLVPLVFALILLTVVLHGTTLAPLARRLGLASQSRNVVLLVGASPWTAQLGGALKEMEIPVLLADSSWHRLRAARLQGIAVHFGEILSEQSEQTLELNEVGHLLAATSNDAYNALVCTHFAHEIGRSRALQLPASTAEVKQDKAVVHALRGLTAFEQGAVYEELQARHYRGWKFQRTRITESYTYEDYALEQPVDRVEILLYKKSGEIVLARQDARLEPVPGDVLLSFVPPAPAKPSPPARQSHEA